MSEISNNRRVAFFTLGCKLNYSETSTIARKFIEQGYRTVAFHDEADVYVVNTCSVTADADKKCRNVIHRTVKKYPQAYMAVIGCYSQLQADIIAAIEGVDLVLGTKEKYNILQYINSETKETRAKIYSCDIDQVDGFDSAVSWGDRTRSFLKVQDGCDYSCSYCTIPLARGKSRNNNIAEIVAEAGAMAAKGIREIVLTGVNVGDFGKSTNENFFQLLKELDKVEGIGRYRISSIEPNLLTHQVIDFVSYSNRFAHHFHVPLQSGCDKILKLMRRRYLRQTFADMVQRAKQAMPDACIGADVIVGFPGESDEDFNDTLQFIEGLDISYLHVFTYSERPNTVAASLPGKVPSAVSSARSKALHQLSEQKRKQFYAKNLGSEQVVLFEHKVEQGKNSGFSSNYIRVEVPYSPKMAGKLARVKLLEISENGNVSSEIIS